MDLLHKRKILFWVLFFNLVIVVAEIAAGVMGNSLALISDAFHNMTDMLSLVIAYIAVVFSSKKPTIKMTYGFIRSEMMAGFVSSLFLILIMLYVVFEALMRLNNPMSVEPVSMIIVAFIAFIANALSAVFLGHTHHNHNHRNEDHHDDDMNIRAAWLHMISDAAISLGVVFGGIAIYLWQIYWIDPVLSLLFSLIIGVEAVKIIRRTFFSLMDENPLDVEKIEQILVSHDHVLSVHDLHIWKPSSSALYLTVHIVLDNDLPISKVDTLLKTINSDLSGHHITHAVLQPEFKACSREGDVICSGAG